MKFALPLVLATPPMLGCGNDIEGGTTLTQEASETVRLYQHPEAATECYWVFEKGAPVRPVPLRCSESSLGGPYCDSCPYCRCVVFTVEKELGSLYRCVACRRLAYPRR